MAGLRAERPRRALLRLRPLDRRRPAPGVTRLRASSSAPRPRCGAPDRPLVGRGAHRRLDDQTPRTSKLMLRWAGCLGETVGQCHTPRPPQRPVRRRSPTSSPGRSRGGERTIITAIERRQATRRGSGALLLDSYGGAINRVPPSATAFVHRNQLFSIQYLRAAGEPRPRGSRGPILADAAARRAATAVSGSPTRTTSTRSSRLGNRVLRHRTSAAPATSRAGGSGWVFRFKQGIRARARASPALATRTGRSCSTPWRGGRPTRSSSATTGSCGRGPPRTTSRRTGAGRPPRSAAPCARPAAGCSTSAAAPGG